MTVYAIKQNLNILQARAYDESFTYLDEDDVAIDLTGVTMFLQVRETVDATDTLLELTTANDGIVITDATAGKFKIYVSATDTGALTPINDAVYDLKVVPATGEDDSYTLMRGTVKVTAAVTR